MGHIIVKKKRKMGHMMIKQEKGKSQIDFQKEEKEIFIQMARLLVRENLMSREEQLRFLSLLKEDE